MLNIIEVSHSSDYFQQIYDYCIQIIKDGKAYADDTDKETMAHERMNGIASKRRDASQFADHLTVRLATGIRCFAW